MTITYSLLNRICRLYSLLEPDTIPPAELIPEFRNLLIRILHRKLPLKPDYLETLLTFYNVIHIISSLYRNLNLQRQEYMHSGNILLKLHGWHTMKSGKCLRKALRSLIAILIRKIDYLLLACDYIQCGKIQPSVTHILGHRVSCHKLKPLLQI